MENNAPVKVGQTVKLRIEAIGEKGDGIAKIKNFVVIVPNTQVNRMYAVEITRILPKFAFGIAKT